MHIRRPKWKSKNGKTYQSAWLCETARVRDETGKSKIVSKYLLNLKGRSKEELDALEFALKYAKKCGQMGKDEKKLSGKPEKLDVEIREGKSFGSAWVIREGAHSLGLFEALGPSRQALLSLWLIIARVIEQGSRLGAIRLQQNTAMAEVLGINEDCTEDDLYEALAWLSQQQNHIEDNLFKHDRKESNRLYLYDVTSSYLEGTENELAAFGYNRDKKKGKMQIVIGLLTDVNGEPITVEVFPGNTLDHQTLESQVKKLSTRFGCQEVVVVGDRGMVKSAQIQTLQTVGFHYITALTKPQIEKLLRQGTLQLAMFDTDIC